MQTTEQQAYERLNKNLEYFQKNHQKLHENILIFIDALADGTYKSNYELEYKDEGYFDVRNLHDGTYLYGFNSQDFAQKKAEEINLAKDEGALALGYRFWWSDAMVEDCEKFSPLLSSFISRANVEHTTSKYGGRLKYFKKIFKFAFLGLGLGTHVKSIHDKIKADGYLFMEDNLELFYLSLFVAPYYELAKNAKLFFIVLNQDFKENFDAFLTDMWIRNDFLKFSLFSDQYAKYIPKLQAFIGGRTVQAYPTNLMMNKNIRLSKVLNKGYNFLNISKIHENSPLKDKKVLFLAAGPSLDEHINWVKANREHFFIIAVFMISAKLHRSGIKPDIIIHVDENTYPIDRILRKFNNDFSFFEGVKFIFSASVDMKILEQIAPKEDSFLIEDNTQYKIGLGSLDFHSVGEVGLALSLLLGATNLYLLGLDLALGKSGQTHSSGHSDIKKDLNKTDQIEEYSSLTDSVFSVKGNFVPLVPTTPLFALSIDTTNFYTKALIKEQKVYNLGLGAYFENTIPFLAKDVKFSQNDSTDKEQFFTFLKEISSNTLSKDEMHLIDIRRNEIHKKIRLLKKFQTSKIRNVRDFYLSFLDLCTNLVTPSQNNASENSITLSLLLELICPFVAEYLNTKDADCSPKALQEIKMAFLESVRKFFYGFGLMEFDYTKADKFFASNFCEFLNEKTFNIDITCINEHQANEIKFKYSLFLDFDGELIKNASFLPLEEKEGVGFFATKANLENAWFTSYIKSLNSPEIEAKLVAFYFENYEKQLASEVFSEIKNIEFVKIQNVEDLINSCRIFINHACWDIASYLDTKFSAFSYRHVEKKGVFYSFNIEQKNQDQSIEEREKERKIYFDAFGADIDENIGFYASYYPKLLQKYGFDIKINKTDKFMDVEKKILFAYALKNVDLLKELRQKTLKAYEIYKQNT